MEYELDTLQLGKVTCPICGHQASPTKMFVKNSFGASRNFFFCNNCHHLFLTPLPLEGELLSFYSNSSVESEANYYKSYLNGRLKRLSKLLKNILNSKSIVLELGPGGVGILPLLPKGATYIAIETSSQNRSSLKEIAVRRSINIHLLENIDQLSKSVQKIHYDIVIAVSVIEHVVNPKLFIEKAIYRLKAGGLVVIGVPYQNIEVPFLINGKLNFCQTHLHSFSEQSLTELVKSLNLKVLNFDFLDKLYAKYKSEIRGFYLSLEDKMHSENYSALFSKKFILRKIIKFFLRYIVLEYAYERANKADYDMIIIAKKNE